MFESMKEHPDLLFNDATLRLLRIDMPINRYLGDDIISMLHRTDDRLCSFAINLVISFQLTIFSNFLIYLLLN